MPGIYSNEGNWFDSKRKYHQFQNPNDRSIYENHGTVYRTENFKTIKSQRGPDRVATLRNSGIGARSRSFADLQTIDRNAPRFSRPSSRAAMAPLVRADPELKDAEKAGQDYHITLNLPANLLGEISNENYESSNYEERSNIEEVVLNGLESESMDENVFATLRLNGPPQKSVVDIRNKEPLRIITGQTTTTKQQVINAVPPAPKPAIINKVVKTATVNVANEKRTARFPVNIDSNSEVRGGFYIKSIVASQRPEVVGFELQLAGGESEQIVESKTIPRPLPPPVQPAKRVEERKIRRIIHEQPVVIERHRRVRQVAQEPPKREKIVRVKKVKRAVKEQREPVREPLREPEVRLALQPLPDVVDKKVEVVQEVAVEIPILEVQKAIPIKLPKKKKVPTATLR